MFLEKRPRLELARAYACVCVCMCVCVCVCALVCVDLISHIRKGEETDVMGHNCYGRSNGRGDEGTRVISYRTLN